MTAPSSPRDEARRVPAVVWALVLAQALLTLGWTQLAPVWRAPDEPHHHDLVRVVRLQQDWVAADRVLSAQITASFDRTAFAYAAVRDLQPLGADDATPRGQRPAFADLADDEPSWAANWLWQHPPLHYLVVACVLTAAEALGPAGGLDYLAEVAAARAVSAAMIAPLPLLAFLAARRLGAGRRAAVGAAAVPLAVPQLAHIGGSVNNDNLLTLLLAAATVGLLSLGAGDLRQRTAVATGGLLGLALLTKAFAAVGVALLPVAVTVGWWRRRAERGIAATAVTALGGGAAAVGVAGGWWLLVNQARYGTLLPHSYDPEPREAFTPDALDWIDTVAADYVVRLWGSFGWFQLELPFAVAATATAAVAVGLLAALWRRRRDLAGLVTLVLAAGVAGGIAAGVLWRAWALHVEYGFYPLVHGRYLLPGLVGVAAALAVAVDRTRLEAAWPWLVLLAGAALQALAATIALLGFWDGGVAAAIAALLAWSSWPPALWGVWLTAAAGSAAAVVVGVAAGPTARDEPPVAATPEADGGATSRQPVTDGAER